MKKLWLAFILQGANHESSRTDPCRDLDYRPAGRRLRLPQGQQPPRRGRRPSRVNPDHPHYSVPVGPYTTVIESRSGEVGRRWVIKSGKVYREKSLFFY